MQIIKSKNYGFLGLWFLFIFLSVYFFGFQQTKINTSYLSASFFEWVSIWLSPILILIIAISLFLKDKFAHLILATSFIIISAETCFLINKFLGIPLLTNSTLIILFGLAILFKDKLSAALYTAAFGVLISQVIMGNVSVVGAVFSAGIGTIIASLIFHADKKYSFSKSAVKETSKSLEVRRQVLHLVVALALAYLIKFQILNFVSVSLITAFGLLLSLISRSKKIPIIGRVLDIFERPKDRHNLPGRGVILLFASTIILLYFFPLHITFYALLITAVGDAVSPLVGSIIGRIKLPWNRKKHLEGLLFSTIITTLSLWWYIPFAVAFISSFTTMFMESVSLKVLEREIDDNVIVPLTAAISLSILLS